MSGRLDGWIGWTTTGCVALLAMIAGTVTEALLVTSRHPHPGLAAS
jgi:hypothetical protein